MKLTEVDKSRYLSLTPKEAIVTPNASINDWEHIADYNLVDVPFFFEDEDYQYFIGIISCKHAFIFLHYLEDTMLHSKWSLVFPGAHGNATIKSHSGSLIAPESQLQCPSDKASVIFRQLYRCNGLCLDHWRDLRFHFHRSELNDIKFRRSRWLLPIQRRQWFSEMVYTPMAPKESCLPVHVY